MSGATDWQRTTAIARIRAALEQSNPPPVEREIRAAAQFVGAEPSVVTQWWRSR